MKSRAMMDLIFCTNNLHKLFGQSGLLSHISVFEARWEVTPGVITRDPEVHYVEKRLLNQYAIWQIMKRDPRFCRNFVEYVSL